MLNHREVVGDKQAGQFQLVLQVHQRIDDLGLDRDIEPRHRLVADDQLRVQCERAGNADALALERPPSRNEANFAKDVLRAAVPVDEI